MTIKVKRNYPHWEAVVSITPRRSWSSGLARSPRSAVKKAMRKCERQLAHERKFHPSK